MWLKCLRFHFRIDHSPVLSISQKKSLSFIVPISFQLLTMSHSGLSHPVFAGNQDSVSSATGPLAGIFGAADIADSSTVNAEQTAEKSASASAQSAEAGSNFSTRSYASDDF